MYNKRIKVFIILSALLLLVCLLRLAQMQLLSHSFYRDKIAELKVQKGLSRQLKTIRGKILDRKGRILAADEPQFQLNINYDLSCFMDERVRRAKLLRAARGHNANLELNSVQKELETKLEDLQQIIDRCTYFGLERADIEGKIKNINNKIWNLRTFLAWVRNDPSPYILKKYNNKIESIPLSEAIADFEKKFPDRNQRLLLTTGVDNIAEMEKDWLLLELETDDDIFTAQLEFMDTDGVRILPEGHRFYHYGTVAAQTIGWVGPATQEQDKELFEDDRLSSYLQDEVCGREDGVEYLCEAILRGKRGEDVSLTLDIELQKKIEEYLARCDLNANCKAPTAVVVIDVTTGDILTLASMPALDLNRIRYDYDDAVRDPNEPLRNRAINKQYPPGSVVKPLILIAGLESGKITPDEIISCPARKAPKGWPSCWLYNRYPWMCHDKWPNNARNAIKGSCNIYFSRLADRIEPLVLQQWLFKFGYGHKIPLTPAAIQETTPGRSLRQAQGQISNIPPESTISRLDWYPVLQKQQQITNLQLPALTREERRYFGIGQGNLRATPLQVANTMAAIARAGLYKTPRLFMDDENRESSHDIDLNISPETLDIVRDGMSAVVNEPGGTAYNEFAYAGFAEQGIKVYGKTGSTEKPDNAWFAGFAEDGTGRSISITVVVEGGQHGSADAAPLARDIIQFCVEAKYIGKTQPTVE
jgi:penicillin-binding protein 2